MISLDDNEDVRSAHHVTSDSDSEVYCDSVDQFGAEEVRLSKDAIRYALFRRQDVYSVSHYRLVDHGGKLQPSQLYFLLLQITGSAGSFWKRFIIVSSCKPSPYIIPYND